MKSERLQLCTQYISFETLLNHRKDLKDLQTKFSLPKTVIAVVGKMGAGKSSLINAVLDQLNILPTSGMRACTAVVVEVISNMKNEKYEADITFLSQEV
jgi:predicted GTPase